MQHVIVIGGGFAGLTAARILSRNSDWCRTTVIDPRGASHFLPLLPDMVGRGIPGRFLTYDLFREGGRCGFEVLAETVEEIDLDAGRVRSNRSDQPFDYVIVASGAETNYYDHPEFRERTYCVDSVDDTQAILDRMREDDFETILIVGGGYAGVEMATVFRRFYQRAGRQKRIVIVQKGDHLLHQLPEPFVTYAEDNLRSLNIEIIPHRTAAEIDRDRVVLDGGERFERAIVVWTAGTQTAGFVRRLRYEQNPQGRLRVDIGLRVRDRVYAAGNAAGFIHGGEMLRMGVQFSLMGGRCAAENVLRAIAGRPAMRFEPVDLGHVVPMANGRSCGVVMGRAVFGRIPTLLHYVMSVFRSYGLENRAGVVRALVRGKSG